jgi:hypothetical protein
MDIVDSSESLTMSGRHCGAMVGDLPTEDLKRVYYYSLFPNMLAQSASRLRHVSHAMAAVSGSDAGHVRVALPSGHADQSRVQAG